MQTLPISVVRNRLNELVDAANVTHERVMITKNGSPAAVLIGADEWESLQETLFWLSQSDTKESVDAARAEVAAGEGLSEEQIRAEFGVPKRRLRSDADELADIRAVDAAWEEAERLEEMPTPWDDVKRDVGLA